MQSTKSKQKRIPASVVPENKNGGDEVHKQTLLEALSNRWQKHPFVTN